MNEIIEAAEQSREKKGHTQPVEVSWSEFLESRRWTPADIAELPDDWLYLQWRIYSLKAKYGIGSY